MSAKLDAQLCAALTQRKSQSRYRSRQCVASGQRANVTLNNQPYLNFCSNDYLGLANHADVRAAFLDAAEEFGVGSGASHLVCGHSRWHHRLENALAEFTGRDRALLFSSGYMANVGALSCLTDRHDAIFQDKLNHASLLDGGLLSPAKMQRYRHNDVSHLQQLLTASTARRKFVVTDGVFSMDGDIAPLNNLSHACREHDGFLMVDDAHGLGVLGGAGQGSVVAANLTQEEVPIYMGTLGKAFGGAGAFIAGSETVIETLIQFARPYIYTTALPPAVAAANYAALEVVKNEPERRSHLNHLITYLRSELKAHGIPLAPSTTAIQPVMIGSDEDACALSNALMQHGIWVSAIRPPTVPEGTARLRITLTANHGVDDVDQLVDALVESYTKLGLAPCS